MTFDSDAWTEGVTALSPPPRPMFARSFNPIPTGEGRLSPPVTTGTPKVFHLPASLSDVLTTSFHEKRILNSEFSRFHRFDFFISEVYFIFIWYKRGFCENIFNG